MEKRYRVTLLEEERQELQSMVSAGKAAARKLVRARILLLADQADGGPGKRLITVAHHRCEEGFLESVNSTFTWAETEHEDGPVGNHLH